MLSPKRVGTLNVLLDTLPADTPNLETEARHATRPTRTVRARGSPCAGRIPHRSSRCHSDGGQRDAEIREVPGHRCDIGLCPAARVPHPDRGHDTVASLSCEAAAHPAVSSSLTTDWSAHFSP